MNAFGGSGGGASNSNPSYAYTPVSTSESSSSNTAAYPSNSSPSNNKTGMNLLNPLKALVSSNTSSSTTISTTKESKTEEEVNRFKRMAGLDLTSNPKSKPPTTVKGKSESSNNNGGMEFESIDQSSSASSTSIDVRGDRASSLAGMKKIGKRI